MHSRFGPGFGTAGSSGRGNNSCYGSPNSGTQAPENPPEPESHGTRLRWQDIPKNVLHDQIAIFTSPAHINRSNAKWWLAFGGGTAALIATDQSFSNALPQNTRLTTPSHWASRLGTDYAFNRLRRRHAIYE